MAGSPTGHPFNGACWDGAEHWESGRAHEVWLLVQAGSETTTPLVVGYFPNGASPVYQFTFN